jgi:hypothetical protein
MPVQKNYPFNCLISQSQLTGQKIIFTPNNKDYETSSLSLFNGTIISKITLLVEIEYINFFSFMWFFEFFTHFFVYITSFK